MHVIAMGNVSSMRVLFLGIPEKQNLGSNIKLTPAEKMQAELRERLKAGKKAIDRNYVMGQLRALREACAFDALNDVERARIEALGKELADLPARKLAEKLTDAEVEKRQHDIKAEQRRIIETAKQRKRR